MLADQEQRLLQMEVVVTRVREELRGALTQQDLANAHNRATDACKQMVRDAEHRTVVAAREFVEKADASRSDKVLASRVARLDEELTQLVPRVNVIEKRHRDGNAQPDDRSLGTRRECRRERRTETGDCFVEVARTERTTQSAA